MKNLVFILSLISLSSCFSLQKRNISQSSDTAAEIKYHWTQILSNSTISFRAVVKAKDCPVINVDGRLEQMSKRQDATELAAVVCEFNANKNTLSAHIGNVQFPKLNSNINSVAVYGDTGCRIKGLIVQNCHDKDAWPFEKINDKITELAPDLVIHVGDYSYRDIKCPAGNEKCEGLAGGKNWSAWEQDVWMPMKKTMAATPFIFIRGNHENCGGFGEFWYASFAAEAVTPEASCKSVTATQIFEHDGIQFINVDSADESNLRAELKKLSSYEKTSSFTWLLTHRPFLSDGPDTDYKKGPQLLGDLSQPGAVQLVMAGHTHLGSFIKFNDGNPPELILGNGGVHIDFFQRSPKKTERSTPYTYKDYGFALLKKLNETDWQLLMLNDDAKTKINCSLSQNKNSATQLNCK